MKRAVIHFLMAFPCTLFLTMELFYRCFLSSGPPKLELDVLFVYTILYHVVFVLFIAMNIFAGIRAIRLGSAIKTSGFDTVLFEICCVLFWVLLFSAIVKIIGLIYAILGWPIVPPTGHPELSN